MKGFLTFTLAAGVAITTTSVVQAAGVGKGALNVDRPSNSQIQAPMSVGSMNGLQLDRSAISRELSRLSELLVPTGSEEEGSQATQRKSMAWSY